MSRFIQIGDVVHVSLNDISQYYQIRSISDGIYISSPEDPNTLSKLVFDPITEQWTIFGTPQNFKIIFLSKDEYDSHISIKIARSKVDSLIKYADYKYIRDNDIRRIYEIYQPGKSIGYFVEKVAGDGVYSSILKDSTRDQVIYSPGYESFETFIKDIASIDLSRIRSIIFDEEGIQLTNQMLEYLCSGDNIEEIFISEERHTLTALPVYHLSKLRSLFICGDRNVSVTDDDLCLMFNLEIIGLSHNNQITNRGLKCLPKLISASLFNNDKVSMDGLSDTNPRLKFIISKDVDEEEISPELMGSCSYHSTGIL